MLHFFRQLRRSFLTENKFNRYLLYAFGEILLVVAGILIALQIDTWNENKKDHALEIKYLNGIVKNIEDDITKLKAHILEDSLQLDGYTTLVRAFTDEGIKSNPQSLLSTIFRIQLINSFEGNNIVFEDLKSSGRTNLIRSDSLRFKILEYYNRSAITIASEKEMHNPAILSLRNQLFITDEVGINGVESLFFPEYWASDLDPSTPYTDFISFLNRDINSKFARGFSNRAGYLKALILAKRIGRIRLLKNAQNLKEKVNEYLMEISD